jgi:hypothetical protein
MIPKKSADPRSRETLRASYCILAGVLLFVYILFLHYRLLEVEKERCRVWYWQSCPIEGMAEK